MDSELLQYRNTSIWDEILRFRPQLQPGHDGECAGVTEALEAFDATCPLCRRWLDLLLTRGLIA